MSEAIVQKWVREAFEKRFKGRSYIFKVPQGPYSSRKGIPDIVMSIGGLFVAVEVKTETGVLSNLQKHELEKIRAVGGLSFIIHGKNLSTMEEMFDIIERELCQRTNTLEK